MQNFRAEQARAAASQRWKAAQKPTGPDAWIERAQEASEILKIDAVERDAAAKSPFAEVQLLKDAGLVNLLGPRKYGGAGETWQTSYKVTMEISKADASIGHLLGNHYSWFWSSQILGTPKQAERWLREFTEGNYYLGGAVNPRNADMVVEDAGLELVFNGEKFFSTGGVISDITVLEGVLKDGTHVFAYVPTKQPGISFKGDWDVIGQRLTESGGCVIRNVRIPWSEAAGFVDKQLTPRDAYHDFILPPVQLQFAAVHLGAAIGALESAAEYTRTRTRAWPYGGDNKAKATEEWYILEGYGRLQAKIWAAEALIDRTAQSVSEAIHAPRHELTHATRGRIAVQVAASKAQVIETALETATKVFDQSSEPLLKSLSSDLTKYVTNEQFDDLLEYWGKEHTWIPALVGFQHMELAQVAQAVFLMLHILLYEASNIHDRRQPSNAVFILQEHFPSAFRGICGLQTTSSQILSKEFLGAAVASGDIEWTKSLLMQGVLPYSSVHLFDLALGSKNAPMIDMLWQSGFAGHVRFKDIDNMDTDVRFAVLINLLRSWLTRATRTKMAQSKYSSLLGIYCGIVLVEAASKGRTIEVTVLMNIHGGAIDRRWLGVALRAAVGFRHFQTAEHLIKFGADIQSPGGFGLSILLNLDRGSLWKGTTPIQIAAEKNDIDLVKLLLRHGANPNPFLTRGSGRIVNFMPLQYAAQHCNFDMVRALLDAGSPLDLDVDGVLGDTPLQISIRLDDERIYGLLLASGAPINSRPAIINGRTAIQAAAGTGNIPLAKILIQKGALLNAPPGWDGGMTALQAAAFGGHSAMIELLFANDADINARPASFRGMTALQAAAASGNHEAVKTLIKLGADVKGPIEHPGAKSPLEEAVQHRDLAMLETLIAHNAKVDTAYTFQNATALGIASQIGWLDGAKYLLNHGANVNVHIMGDDGCSCITALECAIKNNDKPMVQFLLENGAVANITPREFCQRVLCHSISERNDAAIVKLLLQYDPDPEKTFRDGRLLRVAVEESYPHLEVFELLFEKMAALPTPIWSVHVQAAWSCIISPHRLVKKMDRPLPINLAGLLLAAGADINGYISPSTATGLQVALGQGDEELADYLLSRGATSDAPATQYFGTPLQEAVTNGCYRIIPKLLRGGADVNALPYPSWRGAMTAIQAAAENGLLSVARVLLEAGADVTACPNGKTAIQLAALGGRADMVALLLQSLPADSILTATCTTAASKAESKNYVELAEWLRKYPASRGCGTMEL